MPYQNDESLGNFRGDRLVPYNVKRSSHHYAVTVVILVLLLVNSHRVYTDQKH